MNLQLSDVNETYIGISSSSSSSNGVAADLSCDALMLAATRRGHRIHQPRPSLLSARECRVLLEVSRGASNKQVARLLDISPSTVRTHVESIFRKLECQTRAAATMKGSTLGLIS